MKSLIFLCTGNTCRSPMAEAIAKSICKSEDLKIESRGISENGMSASENSKIVAKKYDLNLEKHKSKVITKSDLENASLVLTMTTEHKNLILYNFSKYENKVYTIYEYTLNKNKDILDPFGGSIEEYENCLKELKNLISKIEFNKI